MVKGYPEFYEQVSSLMSQFGAESPDTMAGFMQLHKAGSIDGALSGKVKELIALGIAICVRCDGCIAFHVHDAIKAGAAHSEMVETDQEGYFLNELINSTNNRRNTKIFPLLWFYPFKMIHKQDILILDNVETHFISEPIVGTTFTLNLPQLN